jgi:hypothetical protein
MIAPAAFMRSNSPFTSGVSMFQINRPGAAFLPCTSLCGPTLIAPLPSCQLVYDSSLNAGSPSILV